MNELKLIPTYRVVNRHNVSRNKVEILLVNLDNDFDVITIKVSKTASNMIADSSDYSITTRTKRTWYTLWLGKKYHDKTIRTKYKGQLKPFAKEVKDALESGKAYYKKQLPKHIYVYNLK